MTYKENIRAILECHFTGFKDEIIDSACNRILEQESLTDKEQRIFLSAMDREEKVCKEVDAKYSNREPYEDTLVFVCRSIKSKVRRTLWGSMHR